MTLQEPSFVNDECHNYCCFYFQHNIIITGNVFQWDFSNLDRNDPYSTNHIERTSFASQYEILNINTYFLDVMIGDFLVAPCYTIKYRRD